MFKIVHFMSQKITVLGLYFKRFWRSCFICTKEKCETQLILKIQEICEIQDAAFSAYT